MRVVLDTNIIVSALITPAGKPAAILDAWLDGKFTLLTCAAHVDELRATLQKPRVAAAAREARSRFHGRFSSGPVRSGRVAAPKKLSLLPQSAGISAVQGHSCALQDWLG